MSAERGEGGRDGGRVEGLKERGEGGRSERAIQGTCPLSPSELRGGGRRTCIEGNTLTHTHIY